MVKLLVFVLALSLGVAPSASLAQANESPAQQQEARRFFDRGLYLARSERWADALASFRRSAELVPRASTSYNIANALYRLNRPADGLRELDRHHALAEASGDDEALRREADLRVLLVSAVAEVRFAITPTDGRLFIDGGVSSLSGFERLVRLNPGTHSIRVVREGYVSAVRELEVEAGTREYYAISLERAKAAETEPWAVSTAGLSNTDASEDDRKPFVKRPGFWVMIGAVVVVGVGTGVAVALTRKDDAPECGTTGSCATTQGLTLTSF